MAILPMRTGTVLSSLGAINCHVWPPLMLLYRPTPGYESMKDSLRLCRSNDVGILRIDGQRTDIQNVLIVPAHFPFQPGVVAAPHAAAAGADPNLFGTRWGDKSMK
jgi:hypothetical protein